MEHWDEEIINIVATDPVDQALIERRSGTIRWGWVAAADVSAGTAMGVILSPALVVPFVGWGIWGGFTGGAAFRFRWNSTCTCFRIIKMKNLSYLA